MEDSPQAARGNRLRAPAKRFRWLSCCGAHQPCSADIRDAFMSQCGATMDENNRPPLDKGGLQGGARGVPRTSPNLSLRKEGEAYFQAGSTLSAASKMKNRRPRFERSALHD